MKHALKVISSPTVCLVLTLVPTQQVALQTWRLCKVQTNNCSYQLLLMYVGRVRVGRSLIRGIANFPDVCVDRVSGEQRERRVSVQVTHCCTYSLYRFYDSISSDSGQCIVPVTLPRSSWPLVSTFSRWCGRSRHKINTHVCFSLALDLRPYCTRPPPPELGVVNLAVELSDFVYHLSSVIIHHGAGFSSGHYTSYCWNHEAGMSPAKQSSMAHLQTQGKP